MAECVIPRFLSRPGLDPRPVLTEVLEDKVAVGQSFLPILLFSPARVTSQILYSHFIHVLRVPEEQMDEAL